MTDSIKYFLPESEMPKSWYNIAADLPSTSSSCAPSRNRTADRAR